MRKIFNYLFLLPLAIILVLLSVANRQIVRFSFDPMSATDPAFFVELPFFVFLFVVLLLGIVIGGSLVWLSQGKHRRALRETSQQAKELKQKQQEAEEMTPAAFAEIAPGLPVATRRN